MTLVDAADVRCTRTSHTKADEESSEFPTLVLPRRGFFRYHAGGRSVLADANTALLFHPDEPYRISHPTDHGDDCTALRFTPDAVADALAEIARDVHLSPYHLARRFRAHTGTSLHQYRLALRLNVALARLRDGEADLTALALDLGFAGHAHFTAAFGTAYGCSPSAARSRDAARVAGVSTRPSDRFHIGSVRYRTPQEATGRPR